MFRPKSLKRIKWNELDGIAASRHFTIHSKFSGSHRQSGKKISKAAQHLPHIQIDTSFLFNSSEMYKKKTTARLAAHLVSYEIFIDRSHRGSLGQRSLMGKKNNQFLLDVFDHMETHFDRTNSMIGSCDRQTTDTIIAIAKQFDSMTMIFLVKRRKKRIKIL